MYHRELHEAMMTVFKDNITKSLAAVKEKDYQSLSKYVDQSILTSRLVRKLIELEKGLNDGNQKT